MGANSEIAWTDHTFNPWWGCVRVSPGCQHCYAETFAKRTGNAVWGVDAPRRVFGDKHWAEPLKWNAAAARAGKSARVFCASMADVFENRRDLDVWRERLWNLIDATPSLDWLLLTKRPQNIRNLVPSDWLRDPRDNVWLGTTAEDQQRADERIPALLDVPASVRFVSAEPLIAPVTLGVELRMGLDWLIVGGESGPGARAMDYQWATRLRDECEEAGIWFFYKQGGAAHKCEHDAKGGCLACAPVDLRVREFPAVNG